MNEVQVPVSQDRAPVALNLAKFLKGHVQLKERVALLDNTQDIDMFRFKRLTRLLQSPEYKKQQQQPNSGLPPISLPEDLGNTLVMMIQNQLIIPVSKLHFAEIKQVRGWKPSREKPTLRRTDKATMEPDQYYAWTYTKPNPFILLYSILAIAGVFTIILFPLWPQFMKVGVWYLLMALLGFLGLLFATGIVRFIIYLFSLVACQQPFWLFPNLFADCGFFDSFKPLYAWGDGGDKGKKKAKKVKQAKELQVSTNDTANSPSTSASDAAASGASTSATLASRRKVTLEDVDE